MCEQQFFIEYNLGLKSPSGKKADLGTNTHKVMEILAGIKLSIQNNEKFYIDDILGSVDVDNYDLDDITTKVFEHYRLLFKHHVWTEKDLKICLQNVNKMVSSHNGMFDPRNREIVSSEGHFDITINRPWANYEYDSNGEIMKGQLGIKGTIDLIAKANEETLEIIDLKTGRRLDWATGEEKTLDKLYDDPQLRIYHYAVHKMYPQYNYVIVTINFINDGGPFSVMFSKEDLLKTESMLRTKFETIKKCKKPKLNKTWKCTKLCYFGKNTFENHPTIQPLTEYRDNQVCKKGEYMTICEQIKHETDLKGIKDVVDNYTTEGYAVGKYKPPGVL
jgi:hypothetical protein